MMFETIVCGVDGSKQGFVALAQARRLLAPGGRLVAVTACDDRLAVRTGLNAPRVAAELRAEAAATQAQAEGQLAGLGRSAAVIGRGGPAEVLRRTIERERPDLLVVGSRGTGRAVGILLGSVATTLLHEAPCPVLVARQTDATAAFPRRIVVGVDGSAQAAQAEALATALAARFGATLRVVAALGGKPVHADGLASDTIRDRRGPVAALGATVRDADLLVVGSRGLHGLAALGSVSERVAHRARCSVLVVRPARSQLLADSDDVALAG